MSYAAVAASGPKQSPEEVFSHRTIANVPSSRAPHLPEIEPTDSSTHSLVDVDSPHISSVPSDYSSQSVKTSTQAERLEHEAEDAEREAEQRRRIQHGKERAKEVKEKAKDVKDKAKDKAAAAGRNMRENADNPVIMANAVVVAALGAALGYGAYRKYVAGELSWKVVGLWTGVVGLFAAGDYYISQYFSQKYPPKK